MVDLLDYEDDSNLTFASYIDEPEGKFYKTHYTSDWYSQPQSIVFVYLCVVLVSLLAILSYKTMSKGSKTTSSLGTPSIRSIASSSSSSSTTISILS